MQHIWLPIFSWYMIELGTNQQKRITNGKTNQSITSAEQTLIESVKLFTNLRDYSSQEYQGTT